jgi:hypothetical protein
MRYPLSLHQLRGSTVIGKSSILFSTEFTEWQWPLSGVHSLMRVKFSPGGEGGGARPSPRTKLYCALHLRGQIAPPPSTLRLYVLCAVFHAHYGNYVIAAIPRCIHNDLWKGEGEI